MSPKIFLILILLLVNSTPIVSSSSNFSVNSSIFQGTVEMTGAAQLGPRGSFKLTDGGAARQKGHVFTKFPLQFKNSSNGSVFSFSTTFVFVIVAEDPTVGGHGIAFAISPCKVLPRASPGQYLGLFSPTNEGESSNHIVAVELDVVQDPQFRDIDDNHVGIDINGLTSIKSASAGYFPDNNGSFQSLNLKSGDPLQVWVEYDGQTNQLNVTLFPITAPKPQLPILSLAQDLSSFIDPFMYVGFSSSTGLLSESHYILGWSFKMNGRAQEIDLSRLPKIPRPTIDTKGSKKIGKILATALPLVGFFVLLAMISGTLIIFRRKKFMEVLEDWEVQYGPHRFTYKDLYAATKGFKEKELLGQGGFGRVYRGVLPASDLQVAVKRVGHGSKQGMREFVAEIATIGRLRHPNLVRLLGYCRRKLELLLVYDFMPNGSLDKFLYGNNPSCKLDWKHRFKIIKDVASGLFYLHQQWVQVVVHRDIKASNVLIDQEMNGRLGDFGLAKLFDHGTDLQTSFVAGTFGYIAPELARTGKANLRTDLFAFGVFILEVVCGRRPIEPRTSQEKTVLIDWVFECWQRGNILETIDPKLGTEFVAEEVEFLLKLALLCSNSQAAARPNMSAVVQYLEGQVSLPDDLSCIIKPPNFFDGSSSSSSNEVALQLSSMKISIPSLTITESLVSRGR